MHYLDEGHGDPILLLHGNPTSSYIWRNIIPKLAETGRCIAPDLIGMGRSDQPDIPYRFFDHARYLEEFIHRLELRNITIVGHDWGGALGFYYGMLHERNLRGLAFFETIVKPLHWSDFPSNFRFAFRLFRLPWFGQFLIQRLNLFLGQVVPRGVVNQLHADVMEEYGRPFQTHHSRKPIWQMPNDLPIDGEPADVVDVCQQWATWLGASELPKLLLYAQPGALIRETELAWCRANIRNLAAIDVGRGIHYLQEDRSGVIARHLADWMKSEVIPQSDPRGHGA
jgi:haloalkane dehalogenase